MKSKYVYIVSSPHGGSTLLSLVLGKHPVAENLGEVSFIPKLLALNELCSCGEALGSCPRFGSLFDVFADMTGHDLRRDPYSVFLGDAPKGRFGSGLIDRKQQTRLQYVLSRARGALDTAGLYLTPRRIGANRVTLPSVKASVANTLKLYEATEQAWGCRIVIDASKMPKKAPHLYLADPARVRIIHLTRDGRGVTASRKRYMPVPKAAERWNHYHRISLTMLERWVAPEHRLRLSYESFVTDPEKTLRDVFGWLDVPYSDDCLKFGSGQPIHSAGGNPGRFEVGGGIRGIDDRWKTALTDEDLKVFESRAGRLNRALGYD